MNTTRFYLGLALCIIGGIGLDSNGKALYVVYAFILVGFLLITSWLIRFYRTEKNRRERSLQRTLDKYLREYRGM